LSKSEVYGQGVEYPCFAYYQLINDSVIMLQCRGNCAAT